ncbi:26412_t:CDS:2 [Dentiscutata erythropus]|uniref:26412_t:CDS:1 n=1 Tax=Dentiscutata erythropus TaxID=1348616 RepID=A0A9N8ZI73_9GLOM|nr:26412_t:CDS:2 [Dentiscutata erythropus]
MSLNTYLVKVINEPNNSPELLKLKALKEQARKLGSEFHENFSRPPIAVTFENRANNAELDVTNNNHNSVSFVTTDIVFVTASTLGTTEILLHSQANGLEISSQLGDVYIFLYFLK